MIDILYSIIYIYTYNYDKILAPLYRGKEKILSEIELTVY